jgi:hypothetical protein
MHIRILSVISAVLLTQESLALNVERTSLPERLDASEVVVIAQIRSLEEFDNDGTFWEKAALHVLESSVATMNDQDIPFYYGDQIVDNEVKCCAEGRTYVFFLNKYKDGFTSSSGRHSVYEVVQSVSQLIDESTMAISLEHAENWVYLHKLSKAVRHLPVSGS